MTQKLVWAADALLRRDGAVWIGSNPRCHSHVELSPAAAAAIALLIDGATAGEWSAALENAQGWDRTGLELKNGLWSDPTGCLGRQGDALAGQALVSMLRRRQLVIAADASDYAAYLQPLASIFDQEHLGTFHQRVGQWVTLTLRQRDKWRWWHDIKFTPDGLELNPGPYRDIQQTFFDRYFADEPVAGERILDFACGNGYYSRRFAALGAQVVGVDTAPELIEMARRNDTGGCEFQQPADPQACLAWLAGQPAASYDRVYLSDILLLLMDPQAEPGAAAFAAEFRRLLRPGGRLHLFEPNALFWLSCRFGDPASPYVAVTEYRLPLFNVAPTPEQVVATLAGAGMALIDWQLPPMGEAWRERDPALTAFVDRFPMWDFMTFTTR